MKASNSTLQHLIEGTKVFAVPLYQRRYSWQRRNWEDFWKSILEQYEFSLLEGSGDAAVTHFIGSFVLAPSPGAASAPTRYILVDGQQRMTTAMIALAALRDLLAEHAADDNARSAIVQKFNTLYLHNAFETEQDKKLRVLPTQQDRADFAACVGRTPAAPSGRIGEAYDFFRSSRAMTGADSRGESIDLAHVAEILLSRLTLVEITTERGDSVHKIFQTLNSAGVQLKQVDLLRNHFFMLLPTRGEALYAELWRSMELSLGEGQLDRFFWAELVRRDPRVSRTDVYSAMQRRLLPIEHDEDGVEAFLRQLGEDSWAYRAIIETVETVPKIVEARLAFLRSWGAETARPLMLEVMCRFANGSLSAESVAELLGIVESFLVRRMLVGVPTNNLNRIFSSLTPTLARGALSPADLRRALSEGQKYWPSDVQVIEAIESRPFYFSGQLHQRRMILEILANREGAKEPVVSGQDLTIEHVLPQTPTEEWLDALAPVRGDAQLLHERLVHTLGNLTLTGYNSELGNRSYDEKRQRYSESSLAMTRRISQDFPVWNAEAIRRRSLELAEHVVQLWPGPAEAKIDVQEIESSRVTDAVLLMPSNLWTTVGDMIELTGLDEARVLEEVATLLPALQKRVRAESEDEGAGRMSALDLSNLLSEAPNGE